MKDNISTIPIRDGFSPKKGCPLCLLEKMLEERAVEYITGSAMMESDVRIETNKSGFCREHLNKMSEKGKRLSNALILETHLEELINTIFSDRLKSKADKKAIERLTDIKNSCYVCSKIDKGMDHLTDVLFSLWQKDGEFRSLFNQQEYICLKHYIFLLEKASEKGFKGSAYRDFYDALSKICLNYLTELKADVTHFCSMFDYRSAGKDFGASKDSIERAVIFLTGEK